MTATSTSAEIFAAAAAGDVNRMDRLLQTAKASDVNAITVHNRHRVTPIELAISNKTWDTVYMLWAHDLVDDVYREKCFHALLSSQKYEQAANVLNNVPADKWKCALDLDGQTVLPLLSPYLSFKSFVEFLVQDLPFCIETTASPPSLDINPDYSYSWVEFLDPDLSVSDEVSKDAVVQALLDHDHFSLCSRTEIVRALIKSKDRQLRDAIDTADMELRHFVTSQQYFLKRYELLDGPPVHMSSTAVVLLAYDHGMCDQVFDSCADDDGTLDLNGFNDANAALGREHSDFRSVAHQLGWQKEFELCAKDTDDVMTKSEFLHYCDQAFGKKIKVVLKFMRNADECKRERATRLHLDSKYVLGLSPMALPDDYPDHIAQLRLSRLSNVDMADYRHMVVMPAGDRSLEDIFMKERLSEHQVQAIIREVATALHHLHRNNWVHGDVKKLNVLRVMGLLKLIDLDAATHVNDPIGAKFSSGIAPPEMFYRLPDAAAHASFEQHFNDNAGLWAKVKPKGHFVVRSYRQDADASKLPYELVAATPAIDMWALGCMLFQMVSGEELVPTDVNQDVTADSIHIAATWSDAKLCRRIESQVANQHAQDLLKHLLVVDPASRVSAAAVLDHPFLTGEPGHASTAVVHAFQDIQASHRDVEARLNLLLESAQTTDHLIQTARTQLTTLKQSVVRGVFDASEATVPTSFAVFPERMPWTNADNQTRSSEVEASIYQHVQTFLACCKSVSERTLHGDTLARVVGSITQTRPMYLYLVDEVHNTVVWDAPPTNGSLYPIEVHPQDLSFLTSMLPLVFGGLRLLLQHDMLRPLMNDLNLGQTRLLRMDDQCRNWLDALDGDRMNDGGFDVMAAATAGSPVMRLRGAALRRFKLWLLEKDPDKNFAGLERVLDHDKVVWTSQWEAQRRRNQQVPVAYVYPDENDSSGVATGLSLVHMMVQHIEHV